MSENDRKFAETDFPVKCANTGKKLAYAYEYFKSIDDYRKPIDNLKKEDFLSKLKNASPSGEEIERPKKNCRVV